MSVQLQPSAQLGFQRPLTQLVKRTLSVTNTNSQPVAYKVKTTAPKQYCVRPNSGRIEPGETVEVQVLLQPMKEDPAPGTKCRDKFLVQSVVVTPDKETASLVELWSAVEQESSKKNTIHEQKIRCIYLPAADDSHTGTPTENGAGAKNGTILEEDVKQEASPPSYEPSPQSQSTSDQQTTTNSTSMTTNTVKDSTAPIVATAGGVIASSAAAIGLTGLAQKVESSTGASTSTSTSKEMGSESKENSSTPVIKKKEDEADLKIELAKAKAEIARLTEHLNLAQQSSGLRQRNNANAEGEDKGKIGEKVAVKEMHGGGVGVPLNIVAGLVVGTFVLTWLFF